MGECGRVRELNLKVGDRVKNLLSGETAVVRFLDQAMCLVYETEYATLVYFYECTNRYEVISRAAPELVPAEVAEITEEYRIGKNIRISPREDEIFVTTSSSGLLLTKAEARALIQVLGRML